MNEKQDYSGESSRKSFQVDTHDSSLNYSSEKFDPLRALYASESELSVQSGQQFQNFANFESALIKCGVYGITSKKKNEEIQTTITNPSKVYVSKFDERSFLPHQLPVRSAGSKARHSRNIVSQLSQITGPLALLKKCMEEEKQVKILTRSEQNIRGEVTGKVVTFDKHWNIILCNVRETSRRRKYKYGEAKIIGTPADCKERLKNLNVALPSFDVKSLNRKNVEISRTIQSILIRGEDVVAAIVIDNKCEEQ